MDNTLIIYLVGDNGASAEGSPDGLLNEMTFFNNIQVPVRGYLRPHGRTGWPNTFGHFPAAWAHAMDTPFPVDQADRLPLRRHTKRAGDLLAGQDNGQEW